MGNIHFEHCIPPLLRDTLFVGVPQGCVVIHHQNLNPSCMLDLVDASLMDLWIQNGLGYKQQLVCHILHAIRLMMMNLTAGFRQT